MKRDSLWNLFLCWALGHELEPLIDFMSNEEIRAEFERAGRITRWCWRCGRAVSIDLDALIP